MQINCFKDFRSKTPVESTFEAVVEKVRSDSRLATITAQYRQSGSKLLGCRAQLRRYLQFPQEHYARYMTLCQLCQLCHVFSTLARTGGQELCGTLPARLRERIYEN